MASMTSTIPLEKTIGKQISGPPLDETDLV
jgi:hypothetical protein